jgi:eukaryotic-like serine/threonine-protein kinase
MPRAALLLDIDHFKQINDEFGHKVGDTALVALAVGLRESLAGIDLYRYGGDEFAVILEASDPEKVRTVSSEIVAAASDALEPYGSSVTAGVAVGAAGADLRCLFGDADEALLWAKRRARGCVVDHATITGDAAS